MHRLNRSKLELVSFDCELCDESHALDLENTNQDLAIVSWMFHAGGAMA
jgi:hypothetical protein